VLRLLVAVVESLDRFSGGPDPVSVSRSNNPDDGSNFVFGPKGFGGEVAELSS